MTTLDEEKLQKLFIELSETLKVNYELSTDLNEKYKPVGNKNIGVIAGGGSKNNAFTIRLSYSVITWLDDWLPIVVDMAKIIKRHLELSDRQQFVDNPSWKEKRKGYGFGDGEMSEAPKTYKQ